MYRALNGTSAGEFMARMVPSSAGTVAVLTDLDRLTQYIVMVYATNAHGASPNSNMEIKTTTATGTHILVWSRYFVVVKRRLSFEAMEIL